MLFRFSDVNMVFQSRYYLIYKTQNKDVSIIIIIILFYFIIFPQKKLVSKVFFIRISLITFKSFENGPLDTHLN